MRRFFVFSLKVFDNVSNFYNQSRVYKKKVYDSNNYTNFSNIVMIRFFLVLNPGTLAY